MRDMAESIFYVDTIMNANRSSSLTFPALVRANCIIGIIGSRLVRVPGSFRGLSRLASRLCVSAAYPPGWFIPLSQSSRPEDKHPRRIRWRWRACSITITIRVVSGASATTISRIKVRRGAALPATFVLDARRVATTGQKYVTVGSFPARSVPLRSNYVSTVIN